MRKNYLYSIIVLLGMMMSAVGAQAQSWTASEPAAGTFYIYNVGAERFMTSGTYWGSHASLDPHGAMALTLASSGNGYTISTASIYSGKYLGDNTYMDNDNAAVWVFEAVSGQTNTYKIKLNGTSNYLYNAGNNAVEQGTDANSADYYWKLVTKANLDANLPNATLLAPVNATYQITASWIAKGNGANFGNGGVTPQGWSGDTATDIWGDDGNKTNANYCVEQYQKSFDNYQILTVPNGNYTLTAQGFYRTGVGDKYGIPVLYANSNTQNLKLISEEASPVASENNIANAAASFQQGYYSVGVSTKVTDGTLRIGVSGTDVDWCAFDNFSLYYTGNEDLVPSGGTSVSTGDFYLYNLGSGKYLNQGSTFGTHTIVDGAGAAITISGSTDAYLLHFPKVTGEKYLGNGGWVDCDDTRDDYSTWTFEVVDQPGFSNVYKLKANNGGNYLYWAGGSGDWGDEAVIGNEGSGTATYWILVPKTTREDYSGASTSNPVDMTWKVVNPDFQGDNTSVVAGTDTNNEAITWYIPVDWSGNNYYAQSNNAEATSSRFVEAWVGYWNMDAAVGTFNIQRGSYNSTESRYELDDTEIYQTLTSLPAGKYKLSLTGKAEQQANSNLAIEGVYFYAGTKKTYVTRSQAQAYEVNFVADGTSNVKIGCEVMSTNANWVYFDNVRLTYYGDIAQPLPNDNTTQLTVGQWYYYDATTFGQYQLEGPVANIFYTQNGDNLVDENPTLKSAQSTLILESGRVYFKATAASTTLKITSVNDEGINTTFTVASLNVDGLPSSILGYPLNPDGRGSDGAKDISKYLMMTGKQYDLIAVQEDFNYHGSLISEFNNKYGIGTWRGSLSLTNISIPFNTDGLCFFWNQDNGREAGSESWTRYSTSKATDGNQFIKKGFRYYEVTLADGLKVDVYITHMDAGDTSSGATDSRNAQWTQLANAVIQNSFTTRPKIVLGDFNSRYTRENIVTNFKNPIEETGNYEFHDVWIDRVRNGSYPNVGDASLPNEVVDKVIYLNPTATGSAQLTALTYARETDYTVGTVYGTSDNTALGDHGPIVVQFRATKPATQFNEVKDRWQWTGETATYGSMNWYLYNVHYGSYDSGRQGFLTNDATLVRDPNLSNVKPFALYGDASGASLNNGVKKLQMDYYAGQADYKVKFLDQSESGATNFDVQDASADAGNLQKAYRFHKKINTRDYYLAAESPTEIKPHRNTSMLNAWALISTAQLQAYNRYCAAWDKGYTYLMFLPLEDETVEEMTELLQRTGVRWTDTTTADIEALNAQIERWFDDNQTANIVNPSFELDDSGNQLTTTGTLDNHSVPGWTVPSDTEEGFVSYKNVGGDGWSRNFNDVDGNYVFNTWGGTPANGYYVRQTISDLPEGFYKLKAVACTDAGNSISLQIGNTTQTTPFTVSRPYSQHLEVPLYYHNGEGDIVIGASSTTWFEIDDFKLYRYDYYYDETIGTAEYATTAIRYNTEIPAGVEVYYVTEIKEASGTGEKIRNSIKLAKYEGQRVKAGEGVILYKGGNDQARQFRFYRTDEEVDKISANKLLGAVDRIEKDDKQAGCTYYVLAKKTITYDKSVTTVDENTGEVSTSVVETTEPVVGFYKLAATTAVPAHKAYIRVDANNAFAVKGYIFSFDEEEDITPTAVKKIETDTDAEVMGIYTLDGKRQSQLQRGMNIVRMSDGSVKKILVK